jgi:hypothetical protein
LGKQLAQSAEQVCLSPSINFTKNNDFIFATVVVTFCVCWLHKLPRTNADPQGEGKLLLEV